MKKYRAAWVAVSAVTLLVAGTARVKGEVPAEATGAYREAFGPPPTVEEGPCMAAVAFLPGAGASGTGSRLGPLPLFSLDPGKVPEQAARVVVEGYPIPVRYFEPPRAFPAGSRLLGVEVRGRNATVTVSVPGGGTLEAGPPQALAHTLTQFEGVDSITLAVAGGAPSGPVRPDPALREPPPPPRLLDVVASVHPGEEPEEIDVLFDRPVLVETFRIALGDGTGLPGRTYTSMFDMAVVYRPQDPRILREGLPLDIEWSVRDRTGRRAEGKRPVELRIYRHPE